MGATYNNDRSSRSHLVYEIRVKVQKDSKTKYHNIIICDLAGKEDVISAEKMKKYILTNYEGSKEEGANFTATNNPDIEIIKRWVKSGSISKVAADRLEEKEKKAFLSVLEQEKNE